MRLTGAHRRSRRLAAGLLIGSAIAAGILGLSVEKVPARIEIPSFDLPVAREQGPFEAAFSAFASSAGRDPAGPALLVDLAAYEFGEHGFLPRIGAEGREPRKVFARRGDPADGPRVALLLVEIGLDARSSAAALHTPGPITLVVSPYAETAADWARGARWLGHEVLLEVPVRPARYPLEDAGPLALGAEAGELRLLRDILGRAVGYLGVALEPGLFAANPEVFRPFAVELAARGLVLVELGSASLEGVAGASGLPYLRAVGPVDAELSAQAIDDALALLASRAQERGGAIGFGRPFPITLERLALWRDRLRARNIHLVGVGAFVDAARPTEDRNR
ncbi:MAG: divergent polysaccharide deacetylase family protein [Geminicoccaceae bacterium]|nr:divergent polysaccharide deacetylase family protein [Geminicoccaceae bacterium]